MDHVDVLIVGGGHAGAQCAIALRQNLFAGSVAIVGRENELPYERPPLSKDYFAREKTFERLHIRPAQFWQDKAITLLSGQEVVAVDPVNRTVTRSDGAMLAYGRLVWAAGGDPRRLSCEGAQLSGVHAIRTRADCDRLMAEIDSGIRHVAIIGGGYIGLEAAAALSRTGCRITLFEAAPRILSRVAGADLSAFFEAEHRSHGVDIQTGVTVLRLLGEERVNHVELTDGRIFRADAVIVGIGIMPSVEPLIAAGAAGVNGLDVDAFCRTSLPDVFAVGDCANFACDYADGAVMRVESVQNANDQAVCVARALCGDARPYRAFPWFWSNQYDLKLQTAGISLGHDQSVLRGDPATRVFSVVYLKAGRVIALDCVNSVKDYVQGRKMVEARACPAPALLADPATALKDLI